ncbi:hypothetical protein SISNIDRAFT_387352, partial [Sistotremastrum niveocremeum HHB9708]
VYVAGLVPGPNKPSKAQINRILKHLVDDLEVLWKEGVTIPTPKSPHGRKIRAALVPLVCDLPASNDVAGFRNHNATMACPYCWVTKHELGEPDLTFPPRLSSVHRECAEEWKNAETESEMDRLEQEKGARWSELLRLRYWNPIQFKVIDSMHMISALYERHCRHVLGMSATAADGD